MSSQAFALKWRPRTFDAVTGQDHIVQMLSHTFDSGRFHHAWLLTGTRGVGKTTIARIMAKCLNCERGISSSPCDQCTHCQAISKNKFVDYIELDAASNRGVEDMTSLLEQAAYVPALGRFKVYVIDEAHQLTGHAFNAMLKTLEEPPEHVKFILATTDPQKVPVTVLSRCLQLSLKPLPVLSIANYLEQLLTQEKIVFDKPALFLIGKAAKGSMRDALSILDQMINFGKGKVLLRSCEIVLGQISVSYVIDLLEAICKKDSNKILSIADFIQEKSLSFQSTLNELAKFFHYLTLLHFSSDFDLDIDFDEKNRLQVLSTYFEPETIQLYYQILLYGQRDFNLAPDEYTAFTMTLFRLMAFSPEDTRALEVKKNLKVSLHDQNKVEKKSTQAVSPGLFSCTQENNENKTFEIAHHVAVNSGKADIIQGTNKDLDKLDSKEQERENHASQWQNIVCKLDLKGLTQQLALNTMLVKKEGYRYCLSIHPSHESLLKYQKKLLSSLRKEFGQLYELEINVSDSVHSLLAINQAIELKKKEALENFFQKDQVVTKMKELFGAKLLPNSIELKGDENV